MQGRGNGKENSMGKRKGTGKKKGTGGYPGERKRKFRMQDKRRGR